MKAAQLHGTWKVETPPDRWLDAGEVIVAGANSDQFSS
jgi:hypothetical protein